VNAAWSGDASGAEVAACLDGLTDPAVRDLAWLLFDANLLRAQPPEAPLASPWTDAAQARAVAHWLATLDRDPAPLRAVLERSAVTRLGRYAEILLGWFLTFGPAARLVAANVPLRRAGRTLGECDFLVSASDGRRLHWELAVKCYLHIGEQTTLADFVGPNLRDRFDRKHAHLLGHQLRLTEREEFAWLGYPGPWLAQMFVKGWLFYRAGTLACDPPAIDPCHARGWWVTRSEWPAFAAQQAADGWSVLPRLTWLAPRYIAAGGLARDGALTTAEPTAGEEDPVRRRGTFTERIALAAPVDAETSLAHLLREDEPVMVAAFATCATFVADGASGFVERSRGFIVPDDWPARALDFAREGRD